MGATWVLEGEPTVLKREMFFEMLVRWREPTFLLAGAWVSRPRHTQEPLGL